MAKKSIKAGNAYVEIGIKSRLQRGEHAVQADMDKLAKNLQRRGAGLARLGLTLAAGSAAILAGPIKAASEMQETMGKFSVVFGDSSADVKKWSDTTASAMGVSQQAMASMLSGMQDLLVPMGVLPDSATDMSKELSALAVDLGSFNNRDSGMVFDDLMAAMTGSGEVMKKYGVILSESAVKQELLNQGLDPKTADNAAKAQARLNIIMRGTTAAQGDAVRTSGSFANQTKRLSAQMSDLGVAIGGPLLKDLASLISVVTSGVSAFKQFAEKNQSMLRVVGLSILAVGGFGAALVAVGGMMSVAGIAVGGLATLIGLIASPIGIAVAAIAGLGFAVVKYTDIAGKGIGWLQERFGPLVETIKAAAMKISEAMQTGNIDEAWQVVVDVMELVWLDLTGGIRDAWSDVMGYVLDAGSDMAGGLGQLFVSLGDMLQGLLDGYKSYYDYVYNKVVGLGGDVSGVRTIGAPTSAFDSNFSGTRDSLETTISEIKSFGASMTDSANGQKESRATDREAAKKERQAKIEALRASINATGAERHLTSGIEDSLSSDHLQKSVQEGQKAIGTEMKRSGVSGTFSAFAAGIIGAGPNLDRQQLNVMKEIQKNTRQSAKKDNSSRFA